MNHKFFITGTDTNIGKTYVTCGLLKLCKENGLNAIGLKPLASGSSNTKHGLRNDDALQLQSNSSLKLPYELINPYALIKPFSPNIAAKDEGLFITVNNLLDKTHAISDVQANVIFIEGVGGWLTPINGYQTMADYVIALKIPVILVVGIRLGCINHTLLTHAAIQHANVPIAGWIANCIDPEIQAVPEIISTIQTWINCPLLGTIPYSNLPEKHLTLDFFGAYND